MLALKYTPELTLKLLFRQNLKNDDIMKNKYVFCVIFSVLLSVMLFTSCSDEDISNDKEPAMVKQTIIMYYPWSGESMYSCFNNNITDFEKAIEDNNGLDGKRLIVFIAKNKNDASMVEISFSGNKCRRDTLRKYNTDHIKYITADGIASTFREIKKNAPSEVYSLILGCHGVGWIPINRSNEKMPFFFKQQKKGTSLTRYFGHDIDSDYQTDVTTFAAGIKSAGMKMNFILFDVCYMSNIETAYDLREVTDYLIASPTEIMKYGMPYAIVGKDLMDGNFKGVCDGFKSFYSSYEIPCGTLGVTDCRELMSMAYLMRNINYRYPDIQEKTEGVQILDGFSQSIFFDFGDYVRKTCKDKALLSEFDMLLAKLIPYKANTETFYSDYSDYLKPIKSFSGITISDPTLNKLAFESKKNTSWYKATH